MNFIYNIVFMKILNKHPGINKITIFAFSVFTKIFYGKLYIKT